LYNLSEKLFSVSAEPQISSKSPVGVFKYLFSKIIMLLFGLFRENSSMPNTKDNHPLSRSASHFFPTDFSKYDLVLSYLISFGGLFYTNPRFNLSIRVGRIYPILRLFLTFILVVLSVILLSYLLVLVFYRFDIVLPNILNFNLISTTVVLFSLTNSNLIGSKSFTDLLSIITKVNYNNIEESQGYADLQKKYFLKHESTYFLDKKCSEA
jgi:hypothetical protein